MAIIFEESDGQLASYLMKIEKEDLKNVEKLPAYPGIDLVAAFSLLQGNKGLLLGLYEQFVQLYSGSIEDLRKSFDQGDTEHVKWVVHTIKGVAGNISAIHLFQAAEKFQKQLEEYGDCFADDMLNEFERALFQALESSRQICLDLDDKIFSKRKQL